MNGSPVSGPEDFKWIDDLTKAADNIVKENFKQCFASLDEEMKKNIDKQLKQFEEDTGFEAKDYKIF